ncbi:mucin-6-like [Homarus americanus]|uniref:mucin-6-like n=1 Tax=Homarus americanus TaxID=6706 RepID=UPI001C43A115|nr:mucin-6-like [Homarus americanus]
MSQTEPPPVPTSSQSHTHCPPAARQATSVTTSSQTEPHSSTHQQPEPLQYPHSQTGHTPVPTSSQTGHTPVPTSSQTGHTRVPTSSPGHTQYPPATRRATLGTHLQPDRATSVPTSSQTSHLRYHSSQTSHTQYPPAARQATLQYPPAARQATSVPTSTTRRGHTHAHQQPDRPHWYPPAARQATLSTPPAARRATLQYPPAALTKDNNLRPNLKLLSPYTKPRYHTPNNTTTPTPPLLLSRDPESLDYSCYYLLMTFELSHLHLVSTHV